MAMKMNIPYSKVSCSGNELDYIKQVLESGWLTTATKTAEFESKIAQLTGAGHALAVNSCTAGLHLALDALHHVHGGVGVGDGVFVPTMTFTASAEVVRYMGADPVLLDVDYGTRLITPEILERAIAQRPDVKTLIIVHFGGQSADMGGIMDLCHAHGIRVVVDAAHALPARDGDTMVGNQGDITCFSFYANKTLTTGEGGMVTTNNPDYVRRIKVMRTHGIDRDSFARFTSDKPAWQYDVVAPGFKYNLPDVASAIGLAQLERVHDMRQARQDIAEFYQAQLADNPHLDLPVFRVPSADNAWHLYAVVVKPNAPLCRDDVVHALADSGIGTSVHYTPVHRLAYYADTYQFNPADYPNAERYFAGCVSLPLYADLTDSERQYIVDTINAILPK